MNVGYINSFTICFFVNTYDTVHIVLIKIHIVLTKAYNTYGACGEFFSQKLVYPAEGGLHPFFGRNDLFPPPQKKTASAAKPILVCLYKTLKMGARRSCGNFFCSFIWLCINGNHCNWVSSTYNMFL